MIVSYCLALSSVLVACASQILLKKSANKGADKSFLQKFLNWSVIIAYGCMFLSSVLSMLSLRGMDLKQMPMFQATSFIWIMLFSRVFLKEKITKRMWISILVIGIGIVVYAF